MRALRSAIRRQPWLSREKTHAVSYHGATGNAGGIRFGEVASVFIDSDRLIPEVLRPRVQIPEAGAPRSGAPAEPRVYGRTSMLTSVACPPETSANCARTVTLKSRSVWP